jgi:hypothetical protein
LEWLGDRVVWEMRRGLSPADVLTNLREGMEGKMRNAKTVLDIVDIAKDKLVSL